MTPPDFVHWQYPTLQQRKQAVVAAVGLQLLVAFGGHPPQEV